jgi:hypothetical protein
MLLVPGKIAPISQDCYEHLDEVRSVKMLYKMERGIGLLTIVVG